MTWVQEGIFAAGGDSLPRVWQEFAAQTGISAVLHLRPALPTPFVGPPPAAYLWLDIDMEDDARHEERRLAGAFIEACLAQGRRVLLHASRGRHRTRWAYVAYRIYAGSTVEAALRRAAAAPWMAPYYTDRERWSAFARLVQTQRAPNIRVATEAGG